MEGICVICNGNGFGYLDEKGRCSDCSERNCTDEITCPYCDHIHIDSWELDEDYGEYLCHKCEKEFAYERHTVVTYSAKMID